MADKRRVAGNHTVLCWFQDAFQVTCLSWYIYMQYLTDDAPVLPNGIPMMFVSLVALVTVVSLVAVASVVSLLELLYTKGRVSGDISHSRNGLLNMRSYT